MKIVAVHNFYQQPGGEDQVFASETAMLESKGHSVVRLTETNDRVSEMGSLGLAVATVWNRDAYRRVYEVVQAEKPQIVHFHNTFPLLSPASYYAAARGGAAVVQTLHNYRLICPGAMLLRDGRPCEDCVGRTVPWPGVLHACYRDSRKATAAIATMLTAHRAAGTWKHSIDAFIALTKFSRSRFVAGGLPPSKIFVKSNFMDPDPGAGPGGDAFLFAGRLSREKGLDVLVNAWRSRSNMPQLRIIGDGPLKDWLREQISGCPTIEWLGRLPREQVLEHMRHSLALTLPSVAYENFPVSLVEAYAAGLPVIASDAGVLPELVHDGFTGLIFHSGDSGQLAESAVSLAQDHQRLKRIRAACRLEFEKFYQLDHNYKELMAIYTEAVANRNRRVRNKV